MSSEYFKNVFELVAGAPCIECIDSRELDPPWTLARIPQRQVALAGTASVVEVARLRGRSQLSQGSRCFRTGGLQPPSQARSLRHDRPSPVTP